MKESFASIILAAGQGTRMRSATPKVLHPVAGRPMILHALDAVAPLKPAAQVVVVAPKMEAVKACIHAAFPRCQFAVQREQKGTGHAVSCAMAAVPKQCRTVLVSYGDTPLLTRETLMQLLADKAKHKAAIALLGMRPEDPTGYGRLVMSREPWVDRIVECKDAAAAEKKIPWVWGGVMAFDASFLREALADLKPSPKTGEYYLTALIDVARREGLAVRMTPMGEREAMGVNDRAQLAKAEAIMQDRLRARAMAQGATLTDPTSVYFSYDTVLGRDVTVQPHVVFGPGVTVDDDVQIRAFSHLEGAHIASGAVVGPFARIRPGSVIGAGAHVGNFVEIKKSELGAGAKANHLSYIGDADVGAGANIGAGTITCNYDGVKKSKTVIDSGAFIGSNTALVAPVKVGARAVVGAGSVITDNVPPDTLAIARVKQMHKSRKKKAKRK